MTDKTVSSERHRAFEQIAAARGYDTRRHGDGYAVLATQHAWDFYLAGLQGHSPVQEAGPWQAGFERERAFVQSEDFAHDARLYVDGDFRDEAQRLAYAEQLARWLNVASRDTTMPDGYKPPEPAHIARQALHGVMAALGMSVAADPALERQAPQQVAQLLRERDERVRVQANAALLAALAPQQEAGQAHLGIAQACFGQAGRMRLGQSLQVSLPQLLQFARAVQAHAQGTRAGA